MKLQWLNAGKYSFNLGETEFKVIGHLVDDSNKLISSFDRSSMDLSLVGCLQKCLIWRYMPDEEEWTSEAFQLSESPWEAMAGYAKHLFSSCFMK